MFVGYGHSCSSWPELGLHSWGAQSLQQPVLVPVCPRGGGGDGTKCWFFNLAICSMAVYSVRPYQSGHATHFVGPTRTLVRCAGLCLQQLLTCTLAWRRHRPVAKSLMWCISEPHLVLCACTPWLTVWPCAGGVFHGSAANLLELSRSGLGVGLLL